jgi:hypothetical protein
MSFTDILLSQAGTITRSLREVGAGLLAPRRYLRSIESEPVEATIRRLVVLTLAYAILSALLFAEAGNISPWTIALVGILEAALSLVMVPVFYLVVRSTGGRHALRVSIAYVLTLRFTLIIPALIAYRLFLITEDYRFALLRGLALLIYLALLFTVLPFAYFDRTRDRAMALALAAVAFLVMTTVLPAPLAGLRTSGSRIDLLSPFYDPIGAEVDRFVAPSRITYHGPLVATSFQRVIPLVLSGIANDSASVIVRRDSMRTLALAWRFEQPSFISEYQHDVALATIGRDSAEFRTTRDLLEAKRAWLDQLERMANLFDDFAAHPTAAKLVDLARAKTRETDRARELFDRHSQHILVRLQLSRWGLIDMPRIR